MKTIKSVLIGALVALLGSSAWAQNKTGTASLTVKGTTKNLRVVSNNAFSTARTWQVLTSYSGYDTSVAQVVMNSSYTSNTTRPGVTITANGAGQTVCRVQSTNSGAKDNWDITITVTLTDGGTYALSVKETKQVTCTYTGKYATGAAQWSSSSSKPGVATVSSVSGYNATVTPTITAQAVGDAVITVKNEYITYTYNVRVSNPTEERSVSLSQGKSETVESPLTTEAKITLEPGAEDIVGISTNKGHFVFTGKNDGKSKVTLSTVAKDYVYAVKTATLTATKTVTVDPKDQTKATIEIVSHILPGMTTAPTNRILFIGSTCTSHGLGGSYGKDTNEAKVEARKRISAQLNTLAAKGSVDWYLYGNGSGSAGTITEVADENAGWGHIDMNPAKPIALGTSTPINSSRHRNLKAYLNRIDKNLPDTSHTAYDYIVLSFDSSRLAIDYPGNNTTMERRVAQKLAWYYENDRVIWITEAHQSDDPDPWASDFYTPNNSTDDNNGSWMDSSATSIAVWTAYVSLVDPGLCLASDFASKPYRNKKDNITIAGSTRTSYAAKKNEAHATYNDEGAVEKMLNERIRKPMSFDQKVADVVNTNGLKIVNGTAKMSVSYDGSTWTEVVDGAKVVGNVVTGLVTKIGKEAWTKLEIPVQDMDGRFLVPDLSKDWILSNDVADASIWYADPNARLSDKGARGPAVLMVEENDENTGGKPEEWITSEVETSAPWVFKCMKWKVEAADASMTYDGTGTNITFVVKDATGNIVDPSKYTVAYSNKNSTAWGKINSYTNATDGAQDVFVQITMKGGYGFDPNPQTDSATVTIEKRPITLTAFSYSWPYDGKEHETNKFTVAEDTPYAPGESFVSVEMTDDSRITNHGETNNVIKTVNPGPNTKIENYDITKVPGLLMVSSVQVYGSAPDIVKTYDGEATNIVVTLDPAFEGSEIWYAPDPAQFKTNLTRKTVAKALLKTAAKKESETDHPDDKLFKKDANPQCVDACVSNKVWYKIHDPKGNYSNYYGFAYITIKPREVKFCFPKAEKPYDGNGNYPDLVTNLVGMAMVGDERFDCTGSGVFTNVNVGAGERYFVLNSVKLDAGVNTFFRNYTIKYWADGDYNELTIGSGKDHAESVTVNTTALPNGTDGEITIIPMVIGGVPQPGEPGKQIPIDPKDPTTWTNGAESVVKEYDAKATNIVVTVTDPAAATVYYCYDDGTGKPAGGWKTYASFDGYTDVTNVAPVWYRVEYPNYLPVTNCAFVTITASPIQAVPEGEYPDDPTKPWAQATSVEVWTNKCPSVLGGTNITVDVELYTGDEPTLEYSCDLVSWKTDAEMKKFLNHILATQVWCRVSCEPNYVSTNVTSYVYIKSKESKPDDEEADPPTPGNPGDKLQPNPATAEQTKKVVDAIAANDNRLPVGTGPGKYDPSKPAWDGEGKESGGDHGIQTDAKVNLKVTSIGKLPEDDKKDAEDHLAEEILEVKGRSDVDPDSIKGRSIDVKLLYTRTYSDGTQIEGIDIGGSNTELIPFTIAVALEDDEEILKVTRYHAGVETPLKSPERFELSADRKFVTVYAKTYSEFVIIQGIKVTSPCMGCPWGYKVMLVAKTTVGASVSNVSAKVCGCYRKPTIGKLVGYIWGDSGASSGSVPVGCSGSACACNEWASGRIALWKQWNGKAYPVSGFEVVELDRIGGAKDQSTVEAVFGLGLMDSCSVELAGFGKAAHRANGTVAVKNLTGFFAGTMPIYCSGSTAGDCGDEIPYANPTVVFDLCTGAEVETSVGVAYGKWKMEWDSQLVSRIKGKSVDTPVKPTAKYEDNPGTAFGN